MTVFRERAAGASVVDRYLEVKRKEFIAASGDDLGGADTLSLREDLEGLQRRIEHQLDDLNQSSRCYLVMGRVQSGKTGHQLGMLAWAADRCDVAVIFTGVTEALNGQTTYRIGTDLGTLPRHPVAAQTVPTRGSAEKDAAFLEGVVKRARQRREYREGEGIWPERLPILVAMKTKPRVDALKWLFQQVADELGEGVTALVIDDEADQASPNAAAYKNEEAATYSELKALRDAAKHHVWLSYTATPQAIFLTERDGALRPDFCAVSRPGHGYFGVASLMRDDSRKSRVEVGDWPGTRSPSEPVPGSLQRALCDLLVSAWLRESMPDAFYRRAGETAPHGMRSVQMLIHTSSKVDDHALDYVLVERGLQQLRADIEAAVRQEDVTAAPPVLAASWNAQAERLQARTSGACTMPEFGVEQVWELGGLLPGVEIRVVNSSPNRPTAPMGKLPTDRAGWDAHPIWVVIGGDILGRGLTIPQLVTTYFTRLAQTANEDTVAQQMRFCGYRATYSHVLTVHALDSIFDSFEYLAQVERALISSAQDWQDQDKNLTQSEPTLWYVSRPRSRMKPTRLAVRDRDLVDVSRTRQILSLRQFAQPQAFARNSTQVLSWLSLQQVSHAFEQDWSLVECGAEDCATLLTELQMAGRDDSDRDLALELLSPRMGELGLAGMPFAVFIRELNILETASRSEIPNIAGLASRRLSDEVPQDAQAVWEAGWRPNRGLQPDAWYAEARLSVPHVGDSQRRPIERLGYEAVAAIIEPLAVHSGYTNQIVGAGLAVSLLAPDGYEVRAIGVKG